MKITTLERVQQTQFEILDEIARICYANDIKFQLFAGSLLGAARHGNIIPWDDDIDIAMPRKEYDRFIKIAKEKLDSKYFLQTYESDKKTIFTFTKVRKNGTFFSENGTESIDMHQGIFVDVFPLDNYKEKGIFSKILYFRVNVLKRILRAIHVEKEYEKHNLLIKILKFPFKIFKLRSPYSFNRKIDKLITKYNKEDFEQLNHLTNGTNRKRLNKFFISKEEFYDQTLLKFGNKEYPVPKNYDTILNRIYGNYMKLPPVDLQKPSHGVKISFGDKIETYFD